ncbi:MAG TPA: glycoside hydrolase family 127 protein [Candidatus Atopostipes pullistercoris]|uniref:Glycoside hydrolase family 127 protein n=2 Tax=Bacilli TaxID=91061 RepID=A0A9D2JYF9_9LACT|nr:glycoside hydrolase family 127 protein [Candidatus Atopostipes pullistercoris]HLR52625.1 beta-L-arabinofuranosidase domain-containing protein [Candidatus Avamphibacillus sp.]
MSIKVNDKFWERYFKLIRDEMIPYQWNVLHDQENITIDKERDDENIPSEKSHAIQNLKIAAGLAEGDHYGWLFQDSDVYKWLEAASNSYAIHPDEKLLSMMDEVISLIEAAQDEDGYISTYYQINNPKLKFRRLFESHELYCAGHLIEAAVAHYKATGSERLITVSNQFVQCIKNHFGDEEGKINGADGHQEIELALVKLYEVTKDESLLELSAYFLEVRGQDPDFYKKQLEENIENGLSQGPVPTINNEYHQSHKPVMEQEEAVGHAVRLVYMAAAMADVAYYLNNEKMYEACKKIWKNIVTKRMYITGGIGSTVHGEAFTYDYDLPNDTMYCETCASIGMMFFAKNMLKHETDASYSDILERCLYNTVISGVALDGKHFFYVNPLEVQPEACQKDPGKSHVKATRPSWFGCACCPPNIARTLTSLDQYIYSSNEDSVFAHLFMDNEGEINLDKGTVAIRQETTMPYSGNVRFYLELDNINKMRLGIRIPSWAEDFQIIKDGKEVEGKLDRGYLYLEISKRQTVIDVHFEMKAIQWASHPLVRGNQGKVALQRGPFVYCLEEEDNGENLHLNSITNQQVTEKPVEDSALGDIVLLETIGQKEKITKEWNERLYQKYATKEVEQTQLTFIPYYTWANRSSGQMQVWVNKKE